jgi:hypothetical protein
MLILDLLAALVVAIILSALFALATRRDARKKGLIWLFLLIFLVTWSGGIWARPFGPTLWGVHWLTFFLVGVIVALVLAVFSHRRAPRGRRETLDMLERMEEEKVMEEATYVTLSLFFWLLLIALIVAVAVRYVSV